MKKILSVTLVFVLALSLLTACKDSGNGGGNKGGNSTTPASTSALKAKSGTVPKIDAEVIMPSRLITEEDASQILELSTLEEKNVVDEFVEGEWVGVMLGEPGHWASKYLAEILDNKNYAVGYYSVRLSIYQNAAFNKKDGRTDWLYLQDGGVSFYYDELAKYIEDTIESEVDDVGEKAYFVRDAKYGHDDWTIYAYYDNYMVKVTIGGLESNYHGRYGEEEIAWKKAKCVEAAKMVLERMKDIIG